MALMLDRYVVVMDLLVILISRYIVKSHRYRRRKDLRKNWGKKGENFEFAIYETSSDDGDERCARFNVCILKLNLLIDMVLSLEYHAACLFAFIHCTRRDGSHTISH